MTETQCFEDESRISESLFGELDEQTRLLVKRIHQLDCGCALLRFLSERPRELLVAEDIAFHLKNSEACVKRSLERMVELGLVRRQEIVETAFFGLTTDDQQRRRVQGLCAWRNRWQRLLTHVENLLEGNGPQ